MSQYLKILKDLLRYAEHENYCGYNKHDGLNSRLLETLSFDNKYLRLIFIQGVMRAPVNLRPWLRVRKTINAKGMSLWALAYANMFQLTQEEEYLRKALLCLDWLKTNSSKNGYSGFCWGYPYPWQDVGFFAPTHMPNCVVSCFVGRAFMKIYRETRNAEFLDIARSTCDFLLNDLTRIYEDDTMLCLSYAPVPMDWVVMDTSALAGTLIAEVSAATGEDNLAQDAFRLLNYVVSKKTDYGAWFYSHPPERSHIKHDNYHTGYIVDAILDYSLATGNTRFMDSYWQGLEYYKTHLFLENGAPKWMNDKIYPFDIHGSAQGIISFSKAARIISSDQAAGRGRGAPGHKTGHAPFPIPGGTLHYAQDARKICDWAITNLHDNGNPFFYYQKTRLYTKKFTLMRWCNAWMARALSEFLLGHKEAS